MRRRGCLAALAALAAMPVAMAAGERPRFAVALGSGSMHGVAHIGIVRACERLGLRPELITGTSSGAAIGALWAAGLDSRAIAEVARGIDFSDVSSLASPFPLPWRGLIGGIVLALIVVVALVMQVVLQRRLLNEVRQLRADKAAASVAPRR